MNNNYNSIFSKDGWTEVVNKQDGSVGWVNNKSMLKDKNNDFFNTPNTFWQQHEDMMNVMQHK